jgi:hypothetical protein
LPEGGSTAYWGRCAATVLLISSIGSNEAAAALLSTVFILDDALLHFMYGDATLTMMRRMMASDFKDILSYRNLTMSETLLRFVRQRCQIRLPKRTKSVRPKVEFLFYIEMAKAL